MNAWEEHQLAALVDDGYVQGIRQIRRRASRRSSGEMVTVTVIWLLILFFLCAACGIAFGLLGMAIDVASHLFR